MAYQETFDYSIEQPEIFWKEQARRIQWFTEPATILSKDENGLDQWYQGGKLNTSYLALDYHIEQGRGEQIALIYDSAFTNTIEKFSYIQLRDQVALFAGVMKYMGLAQGDTVIIYMPMIPEAVIAMLACARLGVIHSVVFGGFAPHELAIRIDDALPKLIIAGSCGLEINKVIPYMPLVNEAIKLSTHQPNHVVVVQRDILKADLIPDRDLDWQDLMNHASPATWVPLDATDPLYILYTSGTTGKPKGIVRDNGGHAVALKYSLETVYDIKAGEVFWAASDIGWAVGHSYIVYGPLIGACTTVFFEGKPIKTPDAGTFWRVIDQHKVNVFFTAPTGIRAIKKEDYEGNLFKKYDTSSLRYMFVAGERCDINTYEWLSNLLKIPVIDHWWQTESGSPMLANPMGIEPVALKAGSVYKPVFGYNIQIIEESGEPIHDGKEGLVVIQLPLPPGFAPTLWKDPERFKASYLNTYEGYYLTGDGGYIDEHGYTFITGRIDDVINVAAHRLSTAEMEELVNAHPAVAECAVIGIADELKGQVPLGLVVLKDGQNTKEGQLETELIQLIRDNIGAIACYKKSIVVKRLPKTRSGKILRKIMRMMADGIPFALPSTIDDPIILEEIKADMQRHGIIGSS